MCHYDWGDISWLVPYYRLATKHKVEVRGGKANARYPDLMVHSEQSFTAIDGRKEACVELTDPSPMLVIEVVSPGAESTPNYKRDYQWKPREYASRVELDGSDRLGGLRMTITKAMTGDPC